MYNELMNKETMISHFETLVQDLLDLANRHYFFSGYGVKFPKVQIKEIRSYRSLGRAGQDKNGNWTIWVNFKAVEALGLEKYSATTIPHEVAHIACMFTKIDFGHGRKWQSIARHLGDTGDRCADKEESKAFRQATAGMKKRAVYRYVYTRNDGTKVNFTAHSHKKLQKNPRLLSLNNLKPWEGERVNLRCAA